MLIGDYVVLEIPNGYFNKMQVILWKCEVDSDMFSQSFIVV